jgi:DnaD/phage-associated family protein
MIIIYEVDLRKYFYIPTFKKYQTGTEREAKSVLPAPQESLMTNSRLTHDQIMTRSHGTASASASASASVNESVNESESVDENFQEIMKVYHHEMTGTVTPIIADKIEEAMETIDSLFPGDKTQSVVWITRALQEASLHNARSWAYAEKIINRWVADGFMNTGNKKETDKVSKKSDDEIGGFNI